MNCISKVILCFFLAGICGFNSANVTATDAQVVENETFSLVAGELIVSDGIKEISSGTFNDIDVQSVTKVILPEGLESIRPFTFSKFDNLQEINIPSSVMFVRSRAFGASDIFSPNTKSGIKISVNKEQMPGLIKFAMYNLRPDSIRKTEGVNVDWEIFDASTNKKLSKTFKPTFYDWNKYKDATGYWEDIVYVEPDYEQSVKDDDSYVASDSTAKYEEPEVDIKPLLVEESSKVDNSVAEAAQDSSRQKNVSSGIHSIVNFFEEQAKKEREEIIKNKVFWKTRKAVI